MQREQQGFLSLSLLRDLRASVGEVSRSALRFQSTASSLAESGGADPPPADWTFKLGPSLFLLSVHLSEYQKGPVRIEKLPKALQAPQTCASFKIQL